jgi:hypothetical protein
MSQAVALVSKTIDAPSNEVWRALTTPKTLKTYFMGSDVESDVGPVRFRGDTKARLTRTTERSALSSPASGSPSLNKLPSATPTGPVEDASCRKLERIGSDQVGRSTTGGPATALLLRLPPYPIAIFLSWACLAFGSVSVSTPSSRLAPIFSLSIAPDRVNERSKWPTLYSA